VPQQDCLRLCDRFLLYSLFSDISHENRRSLNASSMLCCSFLSRASNDRRTACTVAVPAHRALSSGGQAACFAAFFGDCSHSLGSRRKQASVLMVCVCPQFVAVAKPVVRTVLRALFEAMYCLHAPLVARTSGTGSGGIATRLPALRLPPPLQRPAEQQAARASLFVIFQNTYGDF